MIPSRNLARNFKKAFAEPGYAATVFYKRLKSYLTYKLSGGRSAYPETISLFLTYRGNLRCKMCGQWGAMGSSRAYSSDELKKQLSIEEIRKLLDDMKSFKPNITLFGGEPLLYKDWPAVVRMVKERGMRCNIITNGVLLEQKAEEIIDSGIDEIIFSLDGPEHIHDGIRGIPGTYKKALAGFRKIDLLKKERGIGTPLINISSALFEMNYNRLHETLRSAEDMGASSITFHHLIFTGRSQYAHHDELFRNLFSCSSADWTGFVKDALPAIDPDMLLLKINELRNMRTSVDISVYPNLTDEDVRRYYTDFDFLPGSYKNRCLSPWMVAYIFPDGSVRPCQSLNYDIGNIREDSFKHIWNSKRALRFRGILKKEKHFPVCPRCTEFYRY